MAMRKDAVRCSSGPLPVTDDRLAIRQLGLSFLPFVDGRSTKTRKAEEIQSFSWRTGGLVSGKRYTPLTANDMVLGSTPSSWTTESFPSMLPMIPSSFPTSSVLIFIKAMPGVM